MNDAKRAGERHRKLVEEGWERRFTAEEPRLSEMKEFYESLDMDVVAEPGTPEDGQECRGCFELEGFQDRYKTVYTRRRQNTDKTESGDLFE